MIVSFYAVKMNVYLKLEFMSDRIFQSNLSFLEPYYFDYKKCYKSISILDNPAFSYIMLSFLHYKKKRCD
ncbi:MAG: hypothetical protein QXQ25_05310 [Thermoplasmata archaeon]